MWFAWHLLQTRLIQDPGGLSIKVCALTCVWRLPYKKPCIISALIINKQTDKKRLFLFRQRWKTNPRGVPRKKGKLRSDIKLIVWAQRQEINEKPFKLQHTEAPKGIWEVRSSLESNSQISVVGAMQGDCAEICVKKSGDWKALFESWSKQMAKLPGDMTTGTSDSTLVKGKEGH